MKNISSASLLKTAFPMMISMISGHLMMFVDRIILARHSMEAVNAAAATIAVVAVFQIAATNISSMAEVFVGQYNGANKKKAIGNSVWQLLWFSFLTALVFWPLAYFSPDFLLPDYHQNDLARPYFSILMMFGPFFPAAAALTAKFVGVGNGKPVAHVVVITNLINVLLDFLFIFGYKSFIPSMGIAGAAMATGISQALQFFILFALFLKSENRRIYHTHNLFFRKDKFIKSLKFATPVSIGIVLEIGGWAFLASFLAASSERALTVFTLGQTVFMLLGFIIAGFQKAVIAYSSNAIGAGKKAEIKHVINSTLGGMLGISIVTMPILVFKSQFLDLIFPGVEASLDIASLVLFQVWIYFLLDGISWAFSGILSAGGQTRFVMHSKIATVWITLICPIIITVKFLDFDAGIIWWIGCMYAAICVVIYYIAILKLPMKNVI